VLGVVLVRPAMTILLTGASGFLGSHVAEALSREGRAVRALVRKTSDTSFLKSLPNVTFAEGSVEDRDSFVRAAEGATAVIHAAGLVKARSRDEFFATNTRGAENALEAARRNRATVRRFVYVSSQAVAGPSEDGSPVLESATPRPVTQYGESKLAGERAAVAAKDEFPVTVIRPPLVYGPRDREVLAFFKAVNNRVLPYMGSPKKKISVIYVADAASACIRALDAKTPSGGVYFVEDGRARTFEELVLAIEGALGRRAVLRFPLPRPVIEAAAVASELYGKATNKAVMLTRDKCNELFAANWVCDAAPAKRDLGWTANVPFEEGTKLTVDWYRSARWL
jgi:nucleoside-diphosphate-sugar epimerase